MSETSEAQSGVTKRLFRGLGKRCDRFVEAATILAAGIQQHYGFDVPIHEVILPAAAMVWIAANSLASYLKEA